MTSPSIGFSWAVSGMIIPPVVFDAPHEHAIVQRSEFHKKLRKLMIQCGHLHTESGSGTSLTAKISTTRLRMRSTLGSIHFATSMTNERFVFGRDEQREDLQ